MVAPSRHSKEDGRMLNEPREDLQDAQGWAEEDAITIAQLREAWRDAQACLAAVEADAETLWRESQYTCLDMLIVRTKAQSARLALGLLPPRVRKA